MTKKYIVLVALFSVASSRAFAQDVEPLITDRPDFTESTATIAPGRLQIEGGATFGRSGSQKSSSFGEILIRRGFGERFEVRVGLNSYEISRDGAQRINGRGDIDLGFKFNFSAGSQRLDWRKPATSLIVASSLVSGSRSLRGAGAQPFAKACFSWPLDEKTGVSANLNVARPIGERGRLTQWGASVSVSRSLTERTGAFFELFGFERDTQNGNGSQFFDTGITHLLSPDLQLDARLGLGINSSVRGPDYFFGSGISRRF